MFVVDELLSFQKCRYLRAENVVRLVQRVVKIPLQDGVLTVGDSECRRVLVSVFVK
jgi:hypothetical protein